ncbi:single-stranded DNA-binding protein [Lactobacillus delbrueckii subsp. bulgaricus]|uniref:single-stranded DNA-binding protein n=1 Tax=Lactobacillus delbrueckii TaxID=1584 RepID=UPI0021A4B9E2|nr:single-stranded DNA-binding protein [Lactobacillus delbrueckii]MCT3465893.1 single-stranded DNA-binding protein [Lactobacillus delbrueckii subsp. bulgaricus]MCT3470826.1 single-stranded DNA-binding protein [Lactobacillus delbrueckii subsp. bulgaricus]
MAGINNVVLVGRLTKDVNLRSTQNGTMVGAFTLAVDRTTKDQDGNRQADFIPCVVWNSKYSKMAENLATYAHKGSLIGVQGRIQTRNYEGKDGKRVYVTEVRVDQFSLLESRQAANDYQQNQYNDQQGGYNQQQVNQLQANWQAPQVANFGSQGQSPTPAGQSDTIDVSSDDLPF